MRHIFVIALFGTLSACANISTLQTARVLPEGQGRLNLGGGYVSFPDLASTQSTTTLKGLPYLEGMFRRGIAKNFDIGVKATLIGTLSVDGKYQLVDAGPFALAIGASGGWVTFSTNSNSVTVLDASIPLYLSYDFAPAFSLYAAPRFTSRFVIATNSATVGAGVIPLLGGSFGFKLGETWGLMAEASYAASLRSGASASQLQGTGSFFFDF